MFGSSIIDIAIGVVFVFLLLSLIASALNEMLFSLFNVRGRLLLEGLKTLLNDGNAGGLVKELYNHGLIFGLFKGDFDPNRWRHLPSYIPPQNFAVALIDVLTPGTSAQRDASEILQSLRAHSQKLAELPETAKVGKPLLAILDAAGADADKLRKGIQEWYNSAMDRVSGWYRYYTQWMLLALGIVLAVTLNVDTLIVARHLSNDAALRQSLVAAAQESAKTPAGQPNSPATSTPASTPIVANDSATGQVSNVNAPLAADPPPGQQATVPASPSPARSIQNYIEQVQTLGLPIGWLSKSQVIRPEGGFHDPDQRAWPPSEGYLAAIRYHLWGWLLTALAVSLGAPFWFDMLNKIMVIRSTVKPREKSQEEPSKDAA